LEKKRGITMERAKKGAVLYTMGLLLLLIMIMMVPPCAFAQDQAGAKRFSQADLDQLLAPIALYPDSLLAQILMTSTHPFEVGMADRWVKENKNLPADQFNTALNKQSWDPSVKALVPYPRILAMMDEKMEWTKKLGDAFRSQQADVMDTVQKLRGQAQEAANPKATNPVGGSPGEQGVIAGGNIIMVEPTYPYVTYPPDYYNVYGPWWWYPGYYPYPPYWYYPPGYGFHHRHWW
jgi:hypothetical protein